MPTKKVTGVSRPNPPHATIAHLRQELKQAHADIKELKVTNAALNDECRTPRMTPEHLADVKSLRESFESANTEINNLAMWLRLNKKAEIERGDHNGRTLSNIVIGYLAQGSKVQGPAQ